MRTAIASLALALSAACTSTPSDPLQLADQPLQPPRDLMELVERHQHGAGTRPSFDALTVERLSSIPVRPVKRSGMNLIQIGPWPLSLPRAHASDAPRFELLTLQNTDGGVSILADARTYGLLLQEPIPLLDQLEQLIVLLDVERDG